MIGLPPGCTISYSIRISVEQLTNDMIEWFRLVGGIVSTEEWYDYRGNPVTVTFVKYGRGKPSYKFKDGTNATLLHFDGADAITASMFIMKYAEQIRSHNLKELDYGQ